ncbi:LysM peptidoglycan-binding domain-containing protein, partial [Psychrobacter sp. AOP7-B1-24]|uniref:LysM peptidoglycan-binding domain-containing protein n=1 Tax=Psychrobacter sp. AOP7-B1-24 TaxID=3457645 RepID=UPI00402B685E
MSNSQKKLTAWFVLLDAQSKVLKNIEYKVTAVNSNEEEEHVVKGKTNSKGATYEFVKPIHTKLCLYVKIGTKDFKKAGNISLPPVKENRLKIKAKISAVLIDSKLKKHGNEAGSIKRKDYKVVTGDTLESIAKKHNTDIATLKRLNPKIKSIHKIFAGHWLKVPVQIGDVGKETEDKPSPSVSTKPPATKTKGSEPVDSEQPWYDKAWDSVKDIHDEADAMIDRAEEAIKDGQQKIIKGTLEAKEQLYDTVFGDDESSKTNNKNKKSPAKTESSNNKTNEPPLEIKKKAGNNQNGNPAEQITYDSYTTVYHIYHDGRIERANGQAEKFAAFIYYDESGGKHKLGRSAYVKGQRWIKKNKKDGDRKVYLVDIRDFLSYKKDSVQYKIHENSEGGKRYYLTGVALAAYLGTLCRLGYIDISFNGFSDANGGPGVSSSHINGEVGDMRYLRKDFKALAVTVFDDIYSHERSLKLVETLYIFGFGQTRNNYTERYSKPELGLKDYTLPHCEHKKFQLSDGTWVRHHHHLHLQGLVANIKDIDVISKVPESSSNGLNITSEQLKKLFPQSSQSDRNTVVKEVNAKLSEFKLDTYIRQRHFFSQIKGEVGDDMKGKTEGWNYSPDALLSFSTYYKEHKDEAYEDGYEKDADDNFIRRANERAIGEKHFSRLNGNRQKTHPQDGYNFRGRGLIQLTGYEKYNGFMENYNNHWKGTPPDTVKTPDLINKMP